MVNVCVFSGGSGWNPFVTMLQSLTKHTTYIMPVSDDGNICVIIGGSTSEIVRAFGGPGIGDLRSRLVRLANVDSIESRAIHDLLSHRLSTDAQQCINELKQILNFTHSLCTNIPSTSKQHIMTFINYFYMQLVHKVDIKSSSIDGLQLDRTTGLFYCPEFQPIPINESVKFDFRHGSVGNFYLTGAMLYFKSLDLALNQMSLVLDCPVSNHVFPVVASEFIIGGPKKLNLKIRRSKSLLGKSPIEPDFLSHSPRTMTVSRNRDMQMRILDQRSVVIAAILTNDLKIVGQCAISHPGKAVGEFAPVIHRESLKTMTPASASLPESLDFEFGDSGSNSIVSSPKLPSRSNLDLKTLSLNTLNSEVCSSNIFFSKSELQKLPSPIQRIHYVDKLSREICPPINPSVATLLLKADHIIYSMGSLYTSIIPCLIVPGIGDMIASNDNVWNKILVLNGSNDRETEGYEAIDFLLAITDALNYSCRAQQYASDVLQISSPLEKEDDFEPIRQGSFNKSYLSRSGSDEPLILGQQSYLFTFQENDYEKSILKQFTSKIGKKYTIDPFPVSAFVTHLVYLSNAEIKVDVDLIESFGVKCIEIDGNDHKMYTEDQLKITLKNLF